jgi:protein-disulfide isomerase
MKGFFSLVIFIGIVGAGLYHYKEPLEKEFRAPLEQKIGEVAANYLEKNPEVIAGALQKLALKQQEEENRKNQELLQRNRAQVMNDKDGSPVMGNLEGKIEMVVFMDPFCGHCRRFKDVVHQALNEVGDLKVILRDIPLLTEKSELLVRAMLAANKQGKYREVQEAFYKTTGEIGEQEILSIAQSQGLDQLKFAQDMNSEAVKSIMKSNSDLAQKLQVSGTPTFILKGHLYPGGVSLETLRDLVQDKPKG